MTAAPEQPIVFFDSVCGLCNYFVDIIVRFDHAKVFSLSPLQGELARELALNSTAREDFPSVILKDETGIHRRSTAVIRILSRLGGIWRAVNVLLLIPIPLRDGIYSFIAQNRYRWFGKKETCRFK